MSDRPSGTICTPAEQAANPDSAHCLTRTDTLGVLFMAEASFVSLAAVGFVFAIILRNIFLIYVSPQGRRRGLRLFHQPMDVLMLNLFFADALQAIGGALSARWVHFGIVESGNFCNAQAIIQNVGDTAVALSNLAIGIFTFVNLWLGRDISSKKLTAGVIFGIWLFIAILVTVGNTIHHDPPYNSPTPNWCWIGKHYLVWRIVTEYLWFWITLLFSLLIYIPILWFRDITSDRWRQAFVFLGYPVSYCLCILPLSVSRWIGFVQESKDKRNYVPSAATFVGITLFCLSGFFNVVLLLKTRPNSGLFGNLVFRPPGRPPSPILSDYGVDQNRTAEDTELGKMEGRLPP